MPGSRHRLPSLSCSRRPGAAVPALLSWLADAVAGLIAGLARSQPGMMTLLPHDGALLALAVALCLPAAAWFRVVRRPGRRTPIRYLRQEKTMRDLTLPALAVLLASTSFAAAQPTPSPDGQPGAGAQMTAPAMDGMGGRMGYGRAGMGRDMMGYRMGRAYGPSGARFRFEKEGARVDIRCSVMEPTRACVEAAGTLLDKLAGQPAH